MLDDVFGASPADQGPISGGPGDAVESAGGGVLTGSTASSSGAEAVQAAAEPVAPPPERPDYLPDKFWDGDTHQVRTEALARSYAELAAGQGAAAPHSEGPSEYRIEPRDPLLENDPALNRRLQAAGFTQDQAQMVYDLASEHLSPLIRQVIEHEAARHTERLIDHFGGKDTWREASRQLLAWGKANLPPQVLANLSTSASGVIALHKMMESDEPGFVTGGTAVSGLPSEGDLKRAMQDPRYWRDHDAGLIAKVAEGFRQLYPNEG